MVGFFKIVFLLLMLYNGLLLVKLKGDNILFLYCWKGNRVLLNGGFGVVLLI